MTKDAQKTKQETSGNPEEEVPEEVSQETANTPESEVTTPEVPEEYSQYFVGLWAGRVPVYKCPYCAYDTREAENIDVHIAQTHPQKWMELEGEEQ